MLICPVCGKVNTEGSHNCDLCGAPLGTPLGTAAGSYAQPNPGASVPSEPLSGPVCPVCKRTNRSISVFCAFCGYRLKTAAMPAPQPVAQPTTLPDPTQHRQMGSTEAGNLPTNTLLKRRYRVLRKIAQGGMGAVYEATDTAAPAGTRWAVKEMSPSALPASERTQAIADFRREAQMLAALHHPNLPQVVETFEELGNNFLVMEFVPGRTLQSMIEHTPGFLPEERVRVWARQLLDVINYLHGQSQPIIYRDLKPANIMLVEGTERIKLIDFGIARFHKAGQHRDTEAFGTAGYAPPEQYGKGQTDQRSDVYALGATLHYLLTKHDPGLNPFNWLPARQYNPAVSPQMEGALQRALSLDPQRRFPSMLEFASALGLSVQTASGAPSRPAIEIHGSPQPTPQSGNRNGSQNKRGRNFQPKQEPQPAIQHKANTPVKQRTQTAQKPKIENIHVAPIAPIAPVAPAIPLQVAATMAPGVGVPGAMPVVPTPQNGAQYAPAPSVPMPVPPVQVAEKQPPGGVTLWESETQAQGIDAQSQTADHGTTNMPAPNANGANNNGNGQRPALVVSEHLLDLGEARWNSKPVRKINLTNVGGGEMRGTVVATQPWVALNVQNFQGNVQTVEVRVKNRELPFGRVELHVPNLFAIIWARARWALPFVGLWFWVVLLVASSMGKILLTGLLGAIGAVIFAEVLFWWWAMHVKLFVPAEKLNAGRLLVKSSGGEQQVELRVKARPSGVRKAIGWTIAAVFYVAELSAVAWIVLAFMDIVPFPVL